MNQFIKKIIIFILVNSIQDEYVYTNVLNLK